MDDIGNMTEQVFIFFLWRQTFHAVDGSTDSYLFWYFSMTLISPFETANIAIVIKIGDITHHQLQSIKFVSLRTMNASVNHQENPTVFPYCYEF
jgi:hypothetical protein